MHADGAILWQQALSRIPAPAAIFATGKGLAKPLGVATGFADPAGRRPFTTETPFRIASNTKTFVAATALRLWERGELDLDQPTAALLTPALTGLLQTAGYGTGEITVRHLLNHSAGIFDHTGTECFTEVIHEAQDHVWRDLCADNCRRMESLMIQCLCRMIEVCHEPSSYWSGSFRVWAG